MNRFFATVGSLWAMKYRARSGKNHRTNRHIGGLPYSRDLRLEWLEDRHLLAVALNWPGPEPSPNRPFSLGLGADAVGSSIAAFTEISTGLTSVYASSVAWGDYDNDGKLDILLTGNHDDLGYVAKVYHNDGNGQFTEDTSAVLPGVTSSSAAWGDYDNDGRLDILLAGETASHNSIAKVYHNNGNGTFSEDTSAGLAGVNFGSAAWGDYDNDGRLDILLTGVGIAKVYHNDGNGHFTEDTSAPLPGVFYSSAAWGDYDNDGRLDIVLTGSSAPNSIAKVYHNDGNGHFSEDVSAGLAGVSAGSVAWGDYDNDGKLDIVLSGIGATGGFIAKVYHNDGGGHFSEDASAGVAGVDDTSVAWGDYDNDGRLDILQTALGKVYHNDDNGIFSEDTSAKLTLGYEGSGAWGDYDNDGRLDILLTGMGVAKVYHNNAPTANTAPAVPTGLSASIVAATAVTLSWATPTDGQTPSPGLGCNLRIGTTPGGSDIVGPMADTANGVRRLSQRGMVQGTNCTIGGLTLGHTYYWSVQAVDAGLGGSVFAVEGIFSTPQPTRPTTQGAYDPANSVFHLRKSNDPADSSEYTLGFGAPGGGWRPLVGDWDGDGNTGVGLYDPRTSTFYLTNSPATGYAQDTIGFGMPDSGWRPLIGDWNADLIPGIGLYDPYRSVFYLTNSLATGCAQYTFGFGVPSAGWVPGSGDWNGDWATGVALYDPSKSNFNLTDSLATGCAQYSFCLGPPGSIPLTGRWGQAGAALLAEDVVQPAALAAPLSAANVPATMAAAIDRWISLGLDADAIWGTKVVITDLPGAYLGQVKDHVIYLDRDAAGHGWFLDPTPAGNEEFVRRGPDGQLQATDPQAMDQIDLVTVLEHELGHVAGLRDLDVSLDDLMSGILPTGVRRPPSAADLDALFAIDQPI